MCLTSYASGDKCGVFRAGYDILVFKQLERTDPSYYSYRNQKWMRKPVVYWSPYRGFLYKLGKIIRARQFTLTKVAFGRGNYDVHKGLHAHTKVWQSFNDDDRDVYFPAIIPKGTLFIVSPAEEVVSLALVVHSWRWYDSRGLKNIKRGDFTLHERVCSLDYYKYHPELVK